MAGKMLKGAVVGASSLLGKELAEELNASSTAVWDLKLLEAGETSGTIASAGDEALVIQEISPEAFSGVDVAFFAGDAAVAREHWKTVQMAGASIVDLTGALERVPGVVVRSPWVKGRASDLATVALVAANPAAVMLAVVNERLRSAFGDVKMAATVMEPASQQDAAGLDELHQQTVGLLSFSTVPKDVYDAQVAFALRNTLGGAAKTNLGATAAMIRRHFAALSGDAALALQLVQAPVFHGYTASVYVPVTADEAAVRKALHGGVVEAQEAGDESPSNESVAGKSEIFVDVQTEPEGDGFWLWIAVDNLRVAASNAAACAGELIALRPSGGVQ